MKKQPVVGIVGGVGSYAGIDLIRKIYDQTNALTDQDHLTISMLSAPHRIEDRTRFLTGESKRNPGYAMADVINSLVLHGASIIGIPCNTAHSEKILSVIKNETPDDIVIVDMIEEVVNYIRARYPDIRRVGVLSTTGTIISNVYVDALAKRDITTVPISDEIQSLYVQPAIYDKKYGIKAFSNPVTDSARNDLLAAISYFRRKGAEAIILGCTEIPLAIPEHDYEGLPLVDSTWVLAETLIKLAAPNKLKK